MTNVLERHFNDLKRIYRHYSCAEPGAAGTMDLNELWMLVKDTKLLDNHLTLNDVQHLFTATANAEVTNENANPKNTTNTSSTSKTNNGIMVVVNELMAPQFVEALVRLSDAKFHDVATAWRDQSNDSGLQSEESTKINSNESKSNFLTLAQCLEKMLDEYIIPYACRSDADRFRRDLSRLEVKAVFRRHRDRLQQLFKKWCVDSSEVMDASQFRSFARDRNFISASFTETELFSVFNKIQDEEGAMLASTGGLQLHAGAASKIKKSKIKKDKEAGTKEDKEIVVETVPDQQESVAMGQLNDEMTFSEFCEALAAIAVFKDPDPYLPLHQKLESFIFASVLGKLSGDD